MATEVTPDPIPEFIQRSDISVELEDFVSPPTTGVGGGRAILNYLYHAGDGSDRLFVADSRGPIWLIDGGTLDPEPFLDLRTARPDTFEVAGQKGLRSFAFHPDFENPGTAGFGKVYTLGTESVETGVPVLRKGFPEEDVLFHDVLTEWEVDPADPTRVDVESRREVVRIAEWKEDHNSDTVMFNPNAGPGDADYGKLYITTGDGGNDPTRFDPRDQAQDPGAALGKILRIDPLEQGDGASYGIPADNPFVSTAGALPEVWALGFRHPQTLSFDTGGSGKMLIGEMGQRQIEEINLGVAGANYGWWEREGTFATVRDDQTTLFTLPDDDASFGFTYPVAQYDHDDPSFTSDRNAVVGGYVYRGSAVPELFGHYLFGDLVNGTIYHVPVDELRLGEQAEFKQLNLLVDGEPTTLLDLVGESRADLRFGQGEDGEVYITTKRDGEIRALASASTPDGPITGTDGPDVLTGTAGDDVINARGGDDRVRALAGNDIVNGEDGADRLFGGPDDDRMTGGAGADKIFGEDGNDFMTGGPDNDSLVGDLGDDELLGDGGNDWIAGREGRDRITGHAGDDILDYNAVAESTTARAGRDFVADFEGAGVAGGDRINLSTIDANESTPGVNDAFVFIGTGAFTDLGQLRVRSPGNNTLVEANTTGSLIQDFVILVNDGSGVTAEDWTAGDFVL